KDDPRRLELISNSPSLKEFDNGKNILIKRFIGLRWYDGLIEKSRVTFFKLKKGDIKLKNFLKKKKSVVIFYIYFRNYAKQDDIK
ncbi:hypothetical protein BpHYR1_001071, partial [Brachionus plicatilis]